MTRPNDRNDRELPTAPSERSAAAKADGLAEGLDETELDQTELDGTLDPWQERFEQSIPDRRDIDGELLEGRMLVELFGGEAPEVAIGQYLIERRLGRGGMGEVYSGRDVLTGHEVAIKLLRPTDDVELDRKRLIREARALAKVKHPNVIALYHIGEHERRLFIVMERIHGQTLAQWQAENPPLPALLRKYADAAQGLAAAHRAGVVHGDFKPSNVLLADDGRVLVSDFGVASVSEDFRPPDGSPDDRSNRGGTALYLSPERAAGADGGPRSDQFSFFAALFQAVHGVGPVPGSDRAELLSNLCEGRLVLAPKSGRRIPSWLERAFQRGLSMDPHRRFAGMDEVAALIERKLSRKGLYVAGSIGAAALLLAIGRMSAPEAPIVIDPLADVWSDQQRQAIESDATLAGPQLVIALDAWADRWQLADEHHAQDPDTRGCLAFALDRFDVLVDRLAKGELSNRVAFLATGELPDPNSCVVDPAAPPEDLPEQQRKAIASGIGEAELARLDLRFDDAISLAELALERARQARWLGAELDALEQIGLALGDKRARTDALDRLQEARQLAVREGKLARAAELQVELALAVGPDIPAARRLESLTWAEDLALGAGHRLDAQLALIRANEHIRQRAFVEAEATLDAAIAKIDVDPLPPYLDIKLHRRRADAIAEQGLARRQDAERAYQHAFERANAVLGGRYDALEETVLWSNMGVTAFHDGDHERAKEWFAKVVARQGQLLPANHPLVVDSLLNLAYIDIEFEDYDAALERAEKALEILSTGVSSDLLADAHGLRAMAYGAIGDWAAALAAIDRAIAAQPDGQIPAQLAIQRAMFLIQLDRAEQAIAVFRDHLPTLESESVSREQRDELIGVWVTWLALLQQQKNPDLAAGEFERIRSSHDIEEADLERLEQAASGLWR